MRERRSGRDVRRAPRAREFDAFAAGAAGRLLHVATLLTAETRARNPYARALLTHVLAQTYAAGNAMRDDDPYAYARGALADRFARTARRHRGGHGGALAALSPRERLVVVLRLYEGIAEEQVAALLGVTEAHVLAVCARAVAALGGGPARRREDRETTVRRLLDSPHPPVPRDLVPRAAVLGGRRLRRARRARRLLWTLAALALLAFVVWASAARPWEPPPTGTTPPLEAW
ncbi:sigma factor-like helix-turn-helix DNA-binding protein [Streptomyces sp. NPDC000963]